MRTLTIVFVLGFLILAFGWGTHRNPSIHVENRSGRGIDEVVFVVGDGTPRRAALDATDATGQTLPVRAEGRARLEVRFDDGDVRVFDAGWFNPAARGDLHLVIVSADSIRVEPSVPTSRTRG